MIELLAVIVILAIIALIATPIILNVIEDSRKSAAEDSAYGYIKAIENKSALSALNNINYKDKAYEYDEIDVDIKGTRPTDGTYSLKKGVVTTGEFCINGYNITYENGKATAQDKCGKEKGKITLSSNTGKYKLEEIKIIEILENKSGSSLSCTSSDESIATCKIEGTKITVTAGKKTGNATLTIKSEKTEIYEETKVAYVVTIEQGLLSVLATGYEGTYDGEEHEITVTSSEATIKYGEKEGEYKLEESPKYSDAGEYTVYYEVSKEGYTTVTGSKIVKITKAEGEVTAPTAKTLTYTGSAQELVNAGSTSTGTIKYKIEGGTYSTTIPTATNPGTYKVYYKVEGDKNHEDVTESSVSVTIKNYKEEILNGTDPEISGSLIPVTIANDGTVTKADATKKWYSYAEKKWANAVILVDETKTYAVGATIPESNIESYFVWIPRYRYQIFNTGSYTTYSGTSNPTTSNAKEIQIVFENKNTTASTGSAVNSWLTHPAFTAFNTNGLWVGKFETTGSISSLTVKPNSTSLREQTVKTMFEKAYNYKRDNESHMMKNTEWGAVAYLSHSKYGINKEVNINNNSDYKTGYSAVASPTCYTGSSTTCNKYGTAASVTLAYNTTTGFQASTTGNITGIYDMSGGAHEYMASYMDGKFGSSGFTSDLVTTYGSKYFDKYSSTSTQTSYNNRILGDATGEMGPFYYYKDGDGTARYHNGWYADYSSFVDSSAPFLVRGGYYSNGVLAGQFYFLRNTGGSNSHIGFRLVLAG